MLLCVYERVQYPCVMYMWCMCGIRAEMDVATWSFCSAVGHALDVVVTDKKHRRSNSLNTSTHTLITGVYGNSRLGT